MNKLYFIRHGENIANITKEFSYKVVDYSLTEKGKLQAEQTSLVFKNIVLDEIWSSPLKRAYETASYISNVSGLDIQVLEELREVNVGSLELQKPDEKSWDLYMSVYKKWKLGELDYKFPDGESYNEMLQRFKIALLTIFNGKNNKNIAIIGHGGIFSSTIWRFFNDDKRTPFTSENNNCSISEINIEIFGEDVLCNLIKFGDFSHLSGFASELISGYPDFIKNKRG